MASPKQTFCAGTVAPFPVTASVFKPIGPLMVESEGRAPQRPLHRVRFVCTPPADDTAQDDDAEDAPLLDTDRKAVDVDLEQGKGGKKSGKPQKIKKQKAGSGSCPAEGQSGSVSDAAPESGDLDDPSTTKKKKKPAKKENADAAGSMRRLLREAKGQWPRMLGGSLCLFAAAGCNLVVPSLFGNVLDAMTTIPTNGVQHAFAVAQYNCGLIVCTLNVLCLRRCCGPSLMLCVIAASVITILGSFLSFGRSYLFAYAGEQLVARIRRRLFKSMLLQEVEFFDTCRTGELISRLSSDTVILKDSVTSDIAMGCVQRW